MMMMTDDDNDNDDDDQGRDCPMSITWPSHIADKIMESVFLKNFTQSIES